MNKRNIFLKAIFCLIVLVGIDYLPVYAQKQKTKVTIIRETYDDQGNKTVETIIKEGAEAEALDLEKLGSLPKDNPIEWWDLYSDSLPFGDKSLNFSFKSPLDFKSFFDSLGMGDFNFFDQYDLPLFGDFGPGDELDNKPKLGIRVSELESQTGVLVMNVMPDTPADEAGIEEGDVILSIDQKKIEAPADLVNHIQSLNLNDEVILDVLRDGKYLEIKARLTSLKPKKEMEIRKI